jgi:hypothetical protein
MIGFLKKLPWWFWVVIGVAILFVWQGLSGFSYSNKLWNMAKAEIVKDEVRIIEDLKKDNLTKQTERKSLLREIDDLKKQRVLLEQEKETLSARNQELENALQNVTIPGNTDDLVILLRKLGLRSATRKGPTQ